MVVYSNVEIENKLKTFVVVIRMTLNKLYTKNRMICIHPKK